MHTAHAHHAKLGQRSCLDATFPAALWLVTVLEARSWSSFLLQAMILRQMKLLVRSYPLIQVLALVLRIATKNRMRPHFSICICVCVFMHVLGFVDILVVVYIYLFLYLSIYTYGWYIISSYAG